MSWLNRQLLLTSVVLILTILLFEVTDMDLLLQSRLFDFDSGKWFLDKNEPITRLLFYDGVRNLFAVFAAVVLISSVLFRNREWLRPYRQGLLVVCLSLVFVPGFMNLAKGVTNVPCPKDISYFGGEYPHATLLQRYPETTEQLGTIRCYPAGHASGGFALMSLFFLFHERKSRRLALTTAITLGWTLGIYKMVIGDHFFSHTLVTMLLAWLLILLMVRLTGLNPEFES